MFFLCLYLIKIWMNRVIYKIVVIIIRIMLLLLLLSLLNLIEEFLKLLKYILINICLMKSRFVFFIKYCSINMKILILYLLLL